MLSPVVIKAKIKSKLESKEFTEVNIKVFKVYKGHNEGLYLRLRFNKCLNKPFLLGKSYIFYLAQEGQRPMARPDLANKKVRRLIKQLACKNCGNFDTIKKVKI